jgi:hypothetical protein
LIFQPCDFSRLVAADTPNGYGAVAAVDGRKGLFGVAGIGPYAGAPAPPKKALT